MYPPAQPINPDVLLQGEQSAVDPNLFAEPTACGDVERSCTVVLAMALHGLLLCWRTLSVVAPHDRVLQGRFQGSL